MALITLSPLITGCSAMGEALELVNLGEQYDDMFKELAHV